MFLTTAILNIIAIGAARAVDHRSHIERRIDSLSEAKNVSDDSVVIGDLATFVSDDGLRRTGDALRIPPKYVHPPESSLNLKVLDMMRQALYATQGRIALLQPILAQYRGDPALRMAFVYNRLKQLIIDLRRIYTLTLKWRLKKRTFEQVTWYTHCTRKYIDVLYIVQYVIETHTTFAKQLKGEDDMPGMPGLKP